MTLSKFYSLVKQELQIQQLSEKQAKVLMNDFYLKKNVNEDDVLRAVKKLEEMGGWNNE